MSMLPETIEQIEKEVSYRYSRSGGPGGQHVNKVSSKVELLFDVMASQSLSHEEKVLVLTKNANRISANGLLRMVCEETRSQVKNKEIAWQRFRLLLLDSLKEPKKRKRTNPSRASKERRLNDKKKLAQKKENRKFDDE